MYASEKGHQDIVNVLLQHGADVAVKNNVSNIEVDNITDVWVVYCDVH